MVKIFISQPMGQKENSEILEERKNIQEFAKDVFGEFTVIESFYEDYNGKPLNFLAKSINDLADADVAIFAKGWEKARGCKIEHTCCVEYGVKTIYM